MKLRAVIEVPLVEEFPGEYSSDFYPDDAQKRNDMDKLGRKLPKDVVVESIEYVQDAVDAKAVFKKLLRFKVDGAPLRGFKSSDYYSKGDEDTPFYSEAYLYNLIGKDDARTVLAHLHQLMSVAGLDPLEVEREVRAELHAEAEAEKVRARRVAARKKFAVEYCAKKGWKLDSVSWSGLDDAQWKELRDAQRAAGV